MGCTLRNDEAALVCTVCETPHAQFEAVRHMAQERNIDDASVACLVADCVVAEGTTPTPTSWVCEVCTVCNDDGILSCSVCDSPHGGFETLQHMSKEPSMHDASVACAVADATVAESATTPTAWS